MITLVTYQVNLLPTGEVEKEELVVKQNIKLSNQDQRNMLLSVLQDMKPVKVTSMSIIFHKRVGTYPDIKLDHFITLSIGLESAMLSMAFGS